MQSFSFVLLYFASCALNIFCWESLTLTRGSVRLWNNALNGLLEDEDVVLMKF